MSSQVANIAPVWVVPNTVQDSARESLESFTIVVTAQNFELQQLEIVVWTAIRADIEPVFLRVPVGLRLVRFGAKSGAELATVRLGSQLPVAVLQIPGFVAVLRRFSQSVAAS